YPKKERIGVHEANVLGIPVVALADTNCDPEHIDYLIPTNDDSIRAVRLLVGKMAEAAAAGLVQREERARAEGEREDADKTHQTRESAGGKGEAYVSRPEAFEEGGMEGFRALAQTEEEGASENSEEGK